MNEVNKTFVPIEYLSDSEELLFQKTREKLKREDSTENLRYYELVLDILMKNSIKRKAEQSKQVDFFIVTIKSDMLFIDTVEELEEILDELEDDGFLDEEIRIHEAKNCM